MFTFLYLITFSTQWRPSAALTFEGGCLLDLTLLTSTTGNRALAYNPSTQIYSVAVQENVPVNVSVVFQDVVSATYNLQAAQEEGDVVVQTGAIDGAGVVSVSFEFYVENLEI